MATISPTTLEALTSRIRDVILAVEPRIIYLQSERWRYAEKLTSAAARTRRFTLVWLPGPFVPGGYFSNGAQEHSATLNVRTDYCGEPEKLQWLVQDDWSQLRDEIHTLTADITSGLTLLLPTSSAPSLADDTPQGRSRVTSRDPTASPAFQIDLSYDLRYLQARS